MLDLRLDTTGHPHDAMMIVGRLFGVGQPQPFGHEDDLLSAAQKVIRTGRPWLCLLDSAELLSVRTVTELRRHVGEVDRMIQDAGSADARLAFVVASRRDEGWRGLTPHPRLSVLALGGFGPGAIQDALEKLALRMSGVHSPAELRKDAAFVHYATEGVPQLVQHSLQWIHSEEWLGIERLEGPEFFNKIVSPYIQDRLLAQDSLLPGEELQPGKSAKQLHALLSALRGLVPYRFITMFHVYHHLDNDRDFRDALKDANWSAEDLWQTIANMALLYRPLDEAWHEIHPAIRRLLYRYFYAPGEHAETHLQARDFTSVWADRLTGKEQVIGIVESIWHETVRLRLINAATTREDLVRFARMRDGVGRPGHPCEKRVLLVPGHGRGRAPVAFPKARVVTVAKCASHAPVLAAIGPSRAGSGSGE
jgi:hypothetical protein